LTYLSYIVGIIIGPLTSKLINQSGNGSTIALGAVVFAFNIERPVPPRIAGSSTLRHSMWITAHPYGVNLKPGPLGSDFSCCFFDQALKGYPQELHNKKKSVEI
jgi:hypothetical protein